jgi:hypothetical protein
VRDHISFLKYFRLDLAPCTYAGCWRVIGPVPRRALDIELLTSIILHCIRPVMQRSMIQSHIITQLKYNFCRIIQIVSSEKTSQPILAVCVAEHHSRPSRDHRDVCQNFQVISIVRLPQRHNPHLHLSVFLPL